MKIKEWFVFPVRRKSILIFALWPFLFTAFLTGCGMGQGDDLARSGLFDRNPDGGDDDPNANDGPSLSTITPAKSETNVAASQNLIMQFSEKVFVGAGNIIIRHKTDNSIFETIAATSSQVTGNGTQSITVDPSVNFVNGTDYFVEIQNNTFFNTAGKFFEGFTDKEEWPFRTISVANPVVTGITPPADDYYNETEDLDFVVAFDINVSVTGGNPRLVLDVGGSTLYAVYASGSGTSSLTFTYDSQNGDVDTDGIAIAATTIDMNGASIVNAADAAGALTNDLTGFIPNLSNVFVDCVAPTTVGSFTFASNDSANNQSPSMAWSGGAADAESGVNHFEIAIGYDNDDDGFDAGDENNILDWTDVPGGSGVAAYQVVDGVDGFSFTSVFDKDHVISIRVVDGADNNSPSVNSATWSTFNPNHFATTEQWLDSSDTSTLYTDSGCSTSVTTNGDPVGCWQDKSTNSNNATASGTDRPSYLATSAVSFVGDAASNANGNCFDISAMPLQSTFLVIENAVDSADGIHGLYGHTTNDEYLFISTNKGYTMSFDGTGSEMGQVALNGGTYSTLDENAGAADLSGDLQIVSAQFQNQITNWANLGCFNHSSGAKTYRANYDLKEIVSVNNTLNATERELVEGYLACKWDLRDQLPITHTYYNATASDDSGCP